jgi:hypothetical protein
MFKTFLASWRADILCEGKDEDAEITGPASGGREEHVEVD